MGGDVVTCLWFYFNFFSKLEYCESHIIHIVNKWLKYHVCSGTGLLEQSETTARSAPMRDGWWVDRKHFSIGFQFPSSPRWLAQVLILLPTYQGPTNPCLYMYWPSTSLVTTYHLTDLPTYLPTYLGNRACSVKDKLPSWNLTSTWLGFIHNWIITDFQWMVHGWWLVHSGHSGRPFDHFTECGLS